MRERDWWPRREVGSGVALLAGGVPGSDIYWSGSILGGDSGETGRIVVSAKSSG